MKIELVSYRSGLQCKNRLKLTTEIINNSSSDLLLFSGHTVCFVEDIASLRSGIINTKSEAIFELKI